MFPEELEFRVLRDSLVLSQTFDVSLSDSLNLDLVLYVKNIFQMQSFSVSGRILIHADGQSVQGATIFVNDKPVTTSGTDGSFVLEKLKAGTYSVHIEARKYLVGISESIHILYYIYLTQLDYGLKRNQSRSART